MKRMILIFIFCVLSIEAFSKEKLMWGMESKKIKKKVSIEKYYNNDFCEILFLPQNSIFDNEYDEYLLFSYKKGLIARLQNTKQDYYSILPEERNCLININLKETKNLSAEITPPIFSDYKELEAFPKENSFEVITLLYGGFDSIYPDEYRVSARDFERYGIINRQGIGYIQKIYNSFGIEPKEYIYNDFKEQNKEYIYKIENNIFNLVKESKIPGPFGTFWGMKDTDIIYIGALYPYIKTGSDFSFDMFEKFFSYDKELMKTHKIIPEKNNEKILSYTAVFDENNSLIQIICVVSNEYANSLKTIGIQTETINQKFKDMKRILESKYGNYQEIKNRGESCLRWEDSSEYNIELLKNSYIHGNGLFSYIWLVYSAPNYNSIKEKIETYKKNKTNKENLKKNEEEQKQNSYF